MYFTKPTIHLLQYTIFDWSLIVIYTNCLWNLCVILFLLMTLSLLIANVRDWRENTVHALRNRGLINHRNGGQTEVGRLTQRNYYSAIQRSRNSLQNSGYNFGWWFRVWLVICYTLIVVFQILWQLVSIFICCLLKIQKEKSSKFIERCVESSLNLKARRCLIWMTHLKNVRQYHYQHVS